MPRNLLDTSSQSSCLVETRLTAEAGGRRVASIDVGSSRCPGYVVVALRGEIDKTHAAWLARAVAPGSRAIVDLEGLAFIDCSGLSAMVSAWKQARQAGGDLLLAAPEQLVLRLLCLTDLTGLLPVFASVDQAANGDGRSPAPLGMARD
jgi:anti-sigma B factor antagonist